MRPASESTWPAPAAGRRRPPATAVLAAAVSAALLGLAAFGNAVVGAGGTAEAGTAAVVALVALAAWVGAARPDRATAVLLAAVGALAAWAAVSIAWSVAGDRSWDGVNLLLATLAFGGLGLVLAAAGGPYAARLGAGVLTLVAALVVGWALLGVAVPSLFPDGDRSARLREPFGHAPVLALVAGAAIPLAGRLLAGPRAARAGGALLAFASGVALLLTQSRAGLLAAAVVVVLWALLAGDGVVRLVRLAPALVPALAVAGFAFTRPALVEDGSARADRVDAGWVFAVVAVVGALVAVALELGVPVERIVRARPGTTRIVLGGLLAAGVVAVVVALVAGGFSEGECANDPGRIVVACANNRLDWWGEAWDVFRAHPTTGTGAETFEVARTRVRATATETSQPHSVPLQLLADLGVVGLALALVAALAGAAALAAGVRRLAGGERQAAAALVAVPVAFAVHALFDYDADFLAATGAALLAGAVVAGAGRPVARSPRAAVPAVVIAGALTIGSLLLPSLSGDAVDAAYEASADGRAGDALRLARRARDLDPLSLTARLAIADVADDDATAEAALLEATELQPENADTWYQLGLFRYEFRAARDACGAWAALNHAYTLDPMSARWVPGGVLDRARADVDAGACEPGG